MTCRPEELRSLAERVAQLGAGEYGSIPRLGGPEPLEELKDCMVEAAAGALLPEAESWVAETSKAVERLTRLLGLKGFTYPREYRSFAEDPRSHLKKKIFNYTYELARGRLSIDSYTRRAAAAIRTSLRTNMRTAYQIWGLATIMALLAAEGYTLAYPEHGFISFDRSGKQRLGIIPPNAVLGSLDEGYLSFYHEAPRPLSWEDSSDLRRVWSFYTALRPDAMIYSGMVLNMVEPSSNPPIKRPTVILEFKELSDWYTRVRDLKGYFKKPLSAEEWRSMWLRGLFEGLADIMGVERREVEKRVEESKTLRVREHQLVKLYAATYKPDVMFLVSRAPVPGEVRRSLEEDGIVVIDAVGFKASRLRPLVEELRRRASFEGAGEVNVKLSVETIKLLRRAMRRVGARTLEEAIRLLAARAA